MNDEYKFAKHTMSISIVFAISLIPLDMEAISDQLRYDFLILCRPWQFRY